MVIFLIVEVIVFKVFVWLGFFGRVFLFWYVVYFKVIWRKLVLILFLSFLFVNINLFFDEVFFLINLFKIVFCCFLIDLYFDFIKLNIVLSFLSFGFIVKIVLNFFINLLRILVVLFIFFVRVFILIFGGIVKWRCKLKYFLEWLVVYFMVVGCFGKWCVFFVNLNDCNDFKIGWLFVLLLVVFGNWLFCYDVVFWDFVVDNVIFDE